MPPSVTAALWTLLVSSLIGAGVAYLLLHRAIPDSPLGSAPVSLGMLLNKSLLGNSVIAWASALNSQIGLVMLSYTASTSDVAQFRVAQQMSMLMGTGLIVSAALYAPRLSALVQLDQIDELRRISRRICVASLAFATPIALVYFLIPQSALHLTFGSYYATAAWPLVYLACGQLLNAAFGAITPLAIATRNERSAIAAHIASVVVNFVLCFVLIPRSGAVGAAIAGSASLAAWNLILFALLWKRAGIRSFAFAG